MKELAVTRETMRFRDMRRERRKDMRKNKFPEITRKEGGKQAAGFASGHCAWGSCPRPGWAEVLPCPHFPVQKYGRSERA